MKIIYDFAIQTRGGNFSRSIRNKIVVVITTITVHNLTISFGFCEHFIRFSQSFETFARHQIKTVSKIKNNPYDIGFLDCAFSPGPFERAHRVGFPDVESGPKPFLAGVAMTDRAAVRYELLADLFFTPVIGENEGCVQAFQRFHFDLLSLRPQACELERRTGCLRPTARVAALPYLRSAFRAGGLPLSFREPVIGLSRFVFQGGPGLRRFAST